MPLRHWEDVLTCRTKIELRKLLGCETLEPSPLTGPQGLQQDERREGGGPEVSNLPPILDSASNGIVKLGGEDDLVAPALQHLSEDPFGSPASVYVGRVDEIHSGVDGFVDEATALLLVVVAPRAEVDGPQRKGAHPESGPGQAVDNPSHTSAHSSGSLEATSTRWGVEVSCSESLGTRAVVPSRGTTRLP